MAIDRCSKDVFGLALSFNRLGLANVDCISSLRVEYNQEISFAASDGCVVRSGHVWRYKEYNIFVKLKLCLVQMCLKPYANEAAHYVLSIDAGSDRDNLLAIFSIIHKLVAKHGICNRDIVHRCRNYFSLSYLKPIIVKILRECSRSRLEYIIEEFGAERLLDMCILDSASLDTNSSESWAMAKRLFSYINEESFKKAKKILREIDTTFFLCFPEEFSEAGYRHLRELFAGVDEKRANMILEKIPRKSPVRLFLPVQVHDAKGFFVHKELEVRIESLRHVYSVESMRMFLKVNQFIENRNAIRLASRYFEMFLMRGCRDIEDVHMLYSEVILPMVLSCNASRRVLGMHLTGVLVKKKYVRFHTLSNLLFDQDYEVRMISRMHSKCMLIDRDEIMRAIRSYQYHDVYGCVDYVRCIENINARDKIMDEMKAVLDEYMMDFVNHSKPMLDYPVHGLINLLSYAARYDIIKNVDLIYERCFQKLSNAIDESESEDMVAYWRNMKECSHYYCTMALRGDRAHSMQRIIGTLLNINHLGILLLAADHLNAIFAGVRLRECEIMEVVETVFDRIKKCKVVFRKSGGIALVLESITKHYPEAAECVLRAVFEQMESENENVKVHCLNVISRVVGSAYNILQSTYGMTELFKLALNCICSEVWRIRSIGIEIFASLVKKVFGRSGHVDDCFLAHSGLRKLLHEYISLQDAKNVLLAAVFHIYARIKVLNANEIDSIKRFNSKSGLLGLQSRIISEGRECKIAKAAEYRMKFPVCLSSGEIISRVLILLDSEHEEEYEMAVRYARDRYGLRMCSSEYLKHCIAHEIVSIGHTENAVQKLRKYGANVVVSSSRFFSDSASNEKFDLDHTLSLLRPSNLEFESWAN
ncbi:hypothetical protein HK407_11g16290 [Ordospora pajunii]|uniref:uncharacterized protein n=1 Tax=Ordospora pajunii TaxID=3039483 RepID=UPI0029527A2C|nr:uncharacterized protein HK407_11g16290 [Ordospora pajunii]KAH9410782.1 hypothetical protein HK407_11g16290 [Ordospora pajunii]